MINSISNCYNMKHSYLRSPINLKEVLEDCQKQTFQNVTIALRDGSVDIPIQLLHLPSSFLRDLLYENEDCSTIIILDMKKAPKCLERLSLKCQKKPKFLRFP